MQLYERAAFLHGLIILHRTCMEHSLELGMHFVYHQASAHFFLTLIPSNLDKALKGLNALSVLRDLMAPSSE